MFKKLTPILVLIGAIAIVSLAVYGFSQFNNPVSKQVDDILGATGWYAGGEVLMGSASNLVSAPNAFVEAAATTTGLQLRTYADGNQTIDQEVDSSKADDGLICVSAIGGTATSTLAIKQMGAIDSATFANVGSTTESITGATTTLSFESKTIFLADPGLTTTTPKCFPVNTKGYKTTRFLIMGDDLPTDENDGVQAFIKYIKIEPITR